ncbi:hypothetical protein EDC01DRAFT_678817 [Geopyxis carbonaria]|nr:hypothetical protein EDC01DRAFT_678817 [Geopyxis carbonaria]
MHSYSQPSPPRGARDYHHRGQDRGRARDREWQAEGPRDNESYQSHSRGHRPAMHDSRDRDSQYYRGSGSRSTSPSRHGAPSGPRDRGRSSGYLDRDAPRSSRSRSPTERFVSRDVIVEGFGGDVQDDDIMKQLSDDLGLSGIEKVTLIRDRKTGLSRGFAFVRFESTKDSMAFVDYLGPTFRLGNTMCRIAFSKERSETGDRRSRRRDDEGTDWTCRVCLLVNFPRRQECFRCMTPRSGVTQTGTLTYPTPTHFTNDGQRDMATSPPSQFLLFRNLEMGVTEEILSRGVLKLAAPTCPEGAAEGSLQRILLVRDRRSNESWRYGFAEFSTPSEAQKAFKAYEKMEKFTISSKPVTASYIHPGVFVPVYNASKEAEDCTFLTTTGLRLAYWDEEGYVSGLVVGGSGESNQGDNVEAAPEESKESKEKSTDKKGKKRKADAAIAPAEKPDSKKTIAPTHLQFWQNRHSELHGLPQKAVQSTDSDGTGNQDPTQRPSTSESFADMKKLACMLCKRGFTSIEKLHEHERVSTMHSTNLTNPALLEAARKKLAKYNTSVDSEYRDRAKERRQVFGRSNSPSKASRKKSKSPEKGTKEEAEVQPSKGASLLGKMGWTAGQGLGAGGDGRTEHVVAEMYASGVGLGMHGAKVGDVEEISKATGSGYTNFVEKTKQRAKERYEGME